MVIYYRGKNIGRIEFNDHGSRVNLLSRRNLDELGSIIANIDSSINALFFISKKQGVFIAGADIKELALVSTKKEALSFCKKGQDLFNAIGQLKMPTYAVVDGSCVGGGMELALSCSYILATDGKSARFGLPEVKLGISPGFGGSHRLRERIGAKEADLLISSGRMMSAREALSSKIVDKIIPRQKKECYEKLARFYVRRPRAAIKKSLSRDKAEKNERELVAEKILKMPAKNALSSYLLVDKYRNYDWLGKGRRHKSSIQKSLVVGAGTMGRGIAYLINSETGSSLNLIDSNKNALKRAKSYIKSTYRDAVERGITCQEEATLKFKNISFNKNLSGEVDLVIESIAEDAAAKKVLLADVERKIRDDCIIATNTSCISIEDLAGSLKNSGRFIGLHFFNPAYKMKLVEVIPARSTKKHVVGACISFLRRLKRIPVIVKDSPGFLVNRIFLPYLNEAIFMARNGVSSDLIDLAMLEFGMPMGPFQILKEIGEDVAYKASKILEDSFGERLKIPSAQGPALNMTNRAKDRIPTSDIAKQLLWPIKREANLCLKEGVVGSPEIIDLALLLGIGFPRSKRIWKI